MAGKRKAARAINWVRSRAVKNFLGLNSLEAHLWPANPKYRAIMRGGKTIGYLRRKLTEKVALDRLDRMLKYEVEYGLHTGVARSDEEPVGHPQPGGVAR